MKIITPQSVTSHSDQPLHFSGSRGEQFRVDVLDHDLIRVRHHPDGKARLDRTWMVLGKDGEMPLEGRSRDDLSGFPLPAYHAEAGDASITVRTDQLTVKIHLDDDFRLEWYDTANQRFAADLRLR